MSSSARAMAELLFSPLPSYRRLRLGLMRTASLGANTTACASALARPLGPHLGGGLAAGQHLADHRGANCPRGFQLLHQQACPLRRH